MGKKKMTLDEVFESTGMLARWETKYVAIGAEQKAVNVAKKMIGLNLPFETIVSVSELDPEKVKTLYQNVD